MFSFPIPINQSQDAPLILQIKLREAFKKKKLAFHQLDLKLLHLPYHEWVPLSNKGGLQARLMIDVIYSNEVSEGPLENEEFKSESKPLAFGRGTSWIESKTKEFKLDYYQRKLYLFGDDEHRMIIAFDFETETFEVLDPPDNLQMMGYSMACGLPNGKIIITGGINHTLNIIVPTAFYYDPVRNRAKVLSSMLQARYTHNLVYKGNYVYSIGGRYYGKGTHGVLEKCEKYDLNHNTWTAIAPLGKNRCTAVAYIQEKFIYVAGGYNGATRINSLERYNDETNVWENCEVKLPNPIEAGCGMMISPDLGVYIGGQDDYTKSDNIFELNMNEKKCQEVGKMKKARLLAHAVLNKEKIYVFGGSDYDWEKIDTTTWTSEICGSYQNIIKEELKTFASCVSHDYFAEDLQLSHEKIIIFCANDHIIHYLKEKNVMEKKTIPHNMKIYDGAAACLIPNGYILIAGGLDSSSYAHKKIYLYNPYNNTFLIGASMINGKWSHALVHYKGFIYSIGGYIKGKVEVNLCERYNVKMNKWEEIEGLSEKRANPHVFLFENSMFCFGGVSNGQPLTSIEKYEIHEDSWKLLEVKMSFSFYEMPSFKLNSDVFFFNRKETQSFSFNLKDLSIKTHTFPSSFYDILSENSNLMALESQELLVFSSKNLNVSVEGFKINPSTPTDLSFHCSSSHTLETSIDHSLEVSCTLKNPKIFSFIDEITLQQDLERESKLLVFSSDNTVLEFNIKTESFDMIKMPILEKPLAFFKHAKALGLPDGKILITGGLFSSEMGVSVVNSAFLYNPFNRTLKQGSSMNCCRFQHAITGSYRFVYCLGGKKFYSLGKEGVLNSCERYDIRDDKWEQLPPMEEGLFNTSACILDKNLYVFGGNSGTALSANIQVLDKIKLFWSKIEVQLPIAVENLGVLTLNYHEILLCGGHTENCSINDVLLMDISTMKLQTLPSLLHTRNNPKVAVFGRNIYVLGGNSMFSAEKAWLTEPKQLKWETLSSYSHLISDDLVEMSYGISRMDLDSLKIDHYTENFEGNQTQTSPVAFDKLYIFGNESFPFILRLKFPSLVWEKLPKPENLQLWDYSVAITLPNGNIFITGGINGPLSSIKNQASLITISGDSIHAKEQPNMLQSRYTHTMCYLNNYIYAMGGRFFGMGVAGVLSHCERFSLATKEWKEIASLNMKSCTAVATIYLSKVYIFGGYRGDGRNKHIERYNELTNLWENVPFLLNNPIEAESLIPLSGHEFVMFGGKDDFMEQNYVIVYDLERGSMKQEKEMIYKRILCKVAKFNEIIYVVGGHADKTCEMAKIGEWQWKEFEGYEKYIDAGLDKPSLVKNAFAQSY